MLHGFTWLVWLAIFTNAAGGMIVAVVMKFAGNILRNFAQACAIIVGGFGSWLLFDFHITGRFVAGVVVSLTLTLTLTLALTLTLTLTWLLAARKGVASRSDCSMISRGSTCEISRRCGGDVGRYRGRYGGDVEEM